MLSDVAGERIAHWREARGWTRKQLAEECQKIDPKLTFESISNIESGRRKEGVRRRTISVDELMIIARGLNVPPVLLLVPYPDSSFVELVPGDPVNAPHAIEWLIGEAFPGDLDDSTSFQQWMETVEPLLFLDTHRRALATYSDRLGLLRRAQHRFAQAFERMKVPSTAPQLSEEELEMNRTVIKLEQANLVAAQDKVTESETGIADLRATMRAKGYPPPPLPRQYSHVDERVGKQLEWETGFYEEYPGDGVKG